MIILVKILNFGDSVLILTSRKYRFTEIGNYRYSKILIHSKSLKFAGWKILFQLVKNFLGTSIN